MHGLTALGVQQYDQRLCLTTNNGLLLQTDFAQYMHEYRRDSQPNGMKDEENARVARIAVREMA